MHLSLSFLDSSYEQSGTLQMYVLHMYVVKYTHIFGVFVETEGHKLFEGLGIASLKIWWVALGD